MNRPLRAAFDDGEPDRAVAHDALRDFHSIPGHLFRRCRSRSTAMFMDVCRAYDITPDQYAVLKVVQIHPEIEQGEAGELSALDASTVGQVIARLRERGLLATRSQGRRRLSSLTVEGAALLAALDPIVAAAQIRTLAPLTRREQQQLLRLMSKLIGAATRHYAPPRARRP